MADKKADLGYMFSLEPREAVKYLESKGYRISRNWYDTWQEAHTKAFTVAKAMNLDILKDIREEVESALKEGKTFNSFQKDLKPKLVQRGWWGKLYNPETGKMEQLGSMRRLRTIYRTNMRTAYSTGKYKFQIDTSKTYPWWKYNATLDAKTRPEHRRLHNKIFRYDDPFWQHFYPPNDWGCRCFVTTLRDKDIIDRKLKTESSKGTISTKTVKINKKGDLRTTKVYKDPVTGNTVQIGPGWAYNPGQTNYFPDLDLYDSDIAHQFVSGMITGPAFNSFYKNPEKVTLFPVAVLNPEEKVLLKSQTQVIKLSGETLIKNLKNHPDLDITDYYKIPYIISEAELIIEDGNRRIVMIKKNNKYYYAVVKTTKTGRALFLTSFRKTNAENIEEIKKRGKVLKDNLK